LGRIQHTVLCAEFLLSSNLLFPDISGDKSSQWGSVRNLPLGFRYTRGSLYTPVLHNFYTPSFSPPFCFKKTSFPAIREGQRGPDFSSNFSTEFLPFFPHAISTFLRCRRLTDLSPRDLHKTGKDFSFLEIQRKKEYNPQSNP